MASSGAAGRPGRSTSTWRPSSTRRAAPGDPGASSCRTATSSSAPRASAGTSATTSTTSSWRRCRSASTPASASSRPPSPRSAHVVLMNYLSAARRRRPPVRQAPGHRAHVRATAVDPARRAALDPGGQRLLRYFANTGGHPGRPSIGCGPSFPRRAVPHVRADRGVPLDLPRPGRGRSPAGLDRQGDPERRDPGRAGGRLAVRSERGASSSIGARWWRWATGTTRVARPSASGPHRTARTDCPPQSWPCSRGISSPATRRASSISWAARTT